MTADATLHTRLLDRLAELDGDIPMDGGMGPALRAVVEQAHAWSLLAPPDDWGDTPDQTAFADAGRHLQRLIANQLGLTEGDARD